ncbi:MULTISPECIES: hypothetical protein [unclassified Massilia]|uniref:hypothetical protein n=1 Tax=unclassified Massilia TaxID=2609279 RepID=UPI000A52337C|nr:MULTISPECIES: hypothetical protein [unclassified Massilia]
MRGISVKKFILVALSLPCCLAKAVVLECPVNAPAEWKVAKARLDRVRVFGPGSEGLPDKEWQAGGVLFQSWKIKTGARRAAYQVDCLYTGTPRFIRFDARSTARCVAKRRVRADTLMNGSMEFRCR